MSDARAQNMEKRRERILKQARRMLAEGGFDALNLRDLAEVSGITVPTIYNLIGNKAEVLKTLVMGAFADYEASVENRLPCPTEQLPALMMGTLTEMMARDEDYYRAAAMASERLENESDEHSDYGFKRAPLRKYAGKLCQDARKEGLLRGEIDSKQLVEQMIGNHQIAFRDWAHHVISLEELRKLSLCGFYIALAADAVDDFRDDLAAELKKL
jgi:AcrR family transcriptional regulator